MIHFMRLSLMKGAHADLSGTAWQEIGVKPAFGLEWKTTALDTPLFVISPVRRLAVTSSSAFPVCSGSVVGVALNLGRFRLLHVVFDSLDWVAKNLLQAHGRQTISLAEVFVDLIPVIHPRPGKAD